MTGDPQYTRTEDGLAAPTGASETEPAYPPAAAGAGTEPAGQAPPPAVERPELTVDRTRTGGLWVFVIAAAVVILLLLIFILQNTRQVEVALFGANPDLPLGVALLLAAVLGALIVALIGTARIIQLRLLARRHRGADRAADRGRRGR
jgi:uncharacterized integral membrane protein